MELCLYINVKILNRFFSTQNKSVNFIVHNKGGGGFVVECGDSDESLTNQLAVPTLNNDQVTSNYFTKLIQKVRPFSI